MSESSHLPAYLWSHETWENELSKMGEDLAEEVPSADYGEKTNGVLRWASAQRIAHVMHGQFRELIEVVRDDPGSELGSEASRLGQLIKPVKISRNKGGAFLDRFTEGGTVDHPLQVFLSTEPQGAGQQRVDMNNVITRIAGYYLTVLKSIFGG
ncbi:MAG: hypothetical protein ACREN8_00225 [Candidatus Dormibacteraceae bacterium]